MANPDANLTVVFKTITVLNQKKTDDAGRPMFDEMEVCEIRFPGDRNRVSVFPAHDFTTAQYSDDGMQQVTYAERFADQYKRFKAKAAQVQDGTPLSELAFLTASQRSELKALNIHTAEQLASLDGQPLKMLGMGGRNLVSQSQAYIEHARDNAVPARQAAEIAELKAELAALKKEKTGAVRRANAAERELEEVREDQDGEDEARDPDDLASWSDDDLTAFIKSETGSAPRGKPSHETLVRVAREAQKAAG